MESELIGPFFVHRVCPFHGLYVQAEGEAPYWIPWSLLADPPDKWDVGDAFAEIAVKATRKGTA
jgi:hypothetical protein